MPAILVASTQGLNLLIWTVVAYLAIHQIEGNLVVPLIQRQLIFIPPAVVLLGIVTILFVFGGVSVIFPGRSQSLCLSLSKGCMSAKHSVSGRYCPVKTSLEPNSSSVESAAGPRPRVRQLRRDDASL